MTRGSRSPPYRPHTDHLYQPVPTTFTDHIPTTYRPHTDRSTCSLLPLFPSHNERFLVFQRHRSPPLREAEHANIVTAIALAKAVADIPQVSVTLRWFASETPAVLKDDDAFLSLQSDSDRWWVWSAAVESGAMHACSPPREALCGHWPNLLAQEMHRGKH